MRTALIFGFVAVTSASAGAAAQHLSNFLAPVAEAPRVIAPLVPTESLQMQTETERARPASRVRVRMPIEANPYGPVPDGRLGEIGGHETGLLDPAGDSSYRRVAGPRPHIASNPYYVSDVDDGQEHKADPSLGQMLISQNPYSF